MRSFEHSKSRHEVGALSASLDSISQAFQPIGSHLSRAVQRRIGVLPDAGIRLWKRLRVSRGDGNRSAICGDHFGSSIYPRPESNDATLIYT